MVILLKQKMLILESVQLAVQNWWNAQEGEVQYFSPNEVRAEFELQQSLESKTEVHWENFSRKLDGRLWQVGL